MKINVCFLLLNEIDFENILFKLVAAKYLLIQGLIIA
jgi:hypothetical protein